MPVDPEMTVPLRIGTRGSPLALVQARWVAARLAEDGVPAELVIIRTEGDDRPVDTAWGEGAFVGAIVGALLDGSVDIAVHSAKDVPTDEHARLVIAAYPPREDPRDALVCRVRGTTLATLSEGARVGTDSPRRTAFLHALRPDLQMHPLHGNVDTRLAKLDRGDSDALVLAVAGLTRLGRADRIDEILPSSHVVSAPGQGSLAIQVRSDDARAIEAVGRLDDPATRVAVEAERALLNATGGGCRSPIGAIGTVSRGRLRLVAAAEREWTPTPDAPIAPSPVVRVRGEAPAVDHVALAERLAARIVTLRRAPRVLVARAAGQAQPLLAALDNAGVAAVNVPAIEILPAVPDGALDKALAGGGAGDWLVITSRNAAVAAVEAVIRSGIDPRHRRWSAIGDGTAAVLGAAGIGVAFRPSTASARVLARELPIAAGDHVVLPRSDIADPALPDALQARGATVTEVIAYRTVEGPEASRVLLTGALDDGPVDALVLTSGSTVRGLLALASAPETQERLRVTPVVAIGVPTAEAASSLGFTTVLVAPSPAAAELAGFVAASLGVSGSDEPLTAHTAVLVPPVAYATGLTPGGTR